MNGMEMMVNALIKSLGLNKDDLQRQALEAFEMFKGFREDMAYVKDAVTRIETAVTGGANLQDDRLVELFAMPRTPPTIPIEFTIGANEHG